MFYSLYNEKVGNALIVSRPVGVSCPLNCGFHPENPLPVAKCYAHGTEQRFPGARKATMENMTIEDKALERALTHAVQNGLDVRIHERGDMGVSNRVDRPYVRVWQRALEKFRDLNVWVYTHFIGSRLVAKLPCHVYASIHNDKDYAKAKAAGFKLFAWILPIHKRKGGSHDAPKFVQTANGRALVCPEQRLGRKRVTCETCRCCMWKVKAMWRF